MSGTTSPMPQFSRVSFVLTDIEGTTSSIRFVKDTLFPYARRELPAFVRAMAESDAVAPHVQAVQQHLREQGQAADLAHVITTLQQWIDEDRKYTALKALHGMIWRSGYLNDAFRGHMYLDVVPELRKWHAAGIRLGVYSSGSVEAQQLFFRYSEAGDITRYFEAYFDTTVGGKREAASYGIIAESLELDPDQILFLSDIEAELDAAHSAGLRVAQLARPEDGTVPSERHAVARSFAEIRVQP